MPSSIEDRTYSYLVTAKLVAEKLNNTPFLVRINTKDGSSKIAKGEGIKWFTHPNDGSVDVAVIPYAPSAEEFEYRVISSELFLSDDIIQKRKIDVGDEVFITGLFAHVSGSQRNLPIVRMGNIAMMPDETIPTDLGNIEAYLVEARSIGGLSGSPAFVRETIPVGFGNSYLLGLMHGHWDIRPERKNDLLMEGDFLGRVNMGIAIVIPAKKILEVLNHPELVERRRKMDER
jgi:hypothetical protein